MSQRDRAILARAEIQAMFARDLAESFRQGPRAALQDLALLAAPWPLELREAACEVALWHGEDDRLIPHAASVHLAHAFRGARFVLAPGEGHFMVFERWREICEWLTAAPRPRRKAL